MRARILRKGAPLAALLLGAGTLDPGSGLYGQALPLEDKARFEKALEEKVEAVLLQMLGPNQAKVVVDATIDFTRMEKLDVRSAELSAEEKAKASRFLWQNMQPQESAAKLQLLPGFPLPDNPLGNIQAQSLMGGNQTYERQISYPQAFLKRLAVTVILNESIPEEQAENIRGIIAGILEIKPERGDLLNIVRASFPPLWKTVWYSTESASFVVKYAATSVMAVMALIVVGYCFLKLSNAMGAMATAQMHQISLEMPNAGGPAELPKPEAAPGAEGARPGADGDAASAEALTFDVKPYQVDTLVHMIAEEEAPNIALVVAHLPPDSRRAFLAKLPAPVTASVLVQLSQVKFIDQDMLATLKEELERRLASALGGLPQVLGLLDQVDLKMKKELLEQLWKASPAVAREVRRRTLLVEDLARLPADEFSFFVLSAPLEDWAFALHGEADAFRALVKAQLPAPSWIILEQTLAARHPTPERAQEAAERIVALARKMVAEGRLSNPMDKVPDLLAAGAGDPPQADAAAGTGTPPPAAQALEG